MEKILFFIDLFLGVGNLSGFKNLQGLRNEQFKFTKKIHS